VSDRQPSHETGTGVKPSQTHLIKGEQFGPA
jgi:hypothetical protein